MLLRLLALLAVCHCAHVSPAHQFSFLEHPSVIMQSSFPCWLTFWHTSVHISLLSVLFGVRCWGLLFKFELTIERLHMETAAHRAHERSGSNPFMFPTEEGKSRDVSAVELFVSRRKKGAIEAIPETFTDGMSVADHSGQTTSQHVQRQATDTDISPQSTQDPRSQEESSFPPPKEESQIPIQVQEDSSQHSKLDSKLSHQSLAEEKKLGNLVF